MFYVIEITTYNNGTADAYGIYPQQNEDVATAVFHQKMASAMRAETYASELCMVIDKDGQMLRREHWIRHIPEETEEG